MELMRQKVSELSSTIVVVDGLKNSRVRINNGLLGLLNFYQGLNGRMRRSNSMEESSNLSLTMEGQIRR